LVEQTISPNKFGTGAVGAGVEAEKLKNFLPPIITISPPNILTKSSSLNGALADFE
jgi:hypothetical protein